MSRYTHRTSGKSYRFRFSACFPRTRDLVTCGRSYQDDDSRQTWLQNMAATNYFMVEITDDTSLLNDDNLNKYSVLIQLQQALSICRSHNRRLYKNLLKEIEVGLAFMLRGSRASNLPVH